MVFLLLTSLLPNRNLIKAAKDTSRPFNLDQEGMNYEQQAKVPRSFSEDYQNERGRGALVNPILFYDVHAYFE
jgi:hypothetical protein